MQDMTTWVQPKLLILVPVLNAVAWMLKRRGRVPDNLIPTLLGLLGIVLACCYQAAASPLLDSQGWMEVLFEGVTQGLLCAASAVYLYQIYHQQRKKEQDKDTNQSTEAAADPEKKLQEEFKKAQQKPDGKS